MEIGDTIEMEEAGAEESSARSAKVAGVRRKNGRNGGASGSMSRRPSGKG